MILLLPLGALALALVVVSVLGLAGIGPLTDERRVDHSSLFGAIGPVIGLAAGGGLLVLMVAGAFLVGVGSADGDTEDRRRGDTSGAPREKRRAGSRSDPR